MKPPRRRVPHGVALAASCGVAFLVALTAIATAVASTLRWSDLTGLEIVIALVVLGLVIYAGQHP